MVLHDGDGHLGYGESPPFELPSTLKILCRRHGPCRAPSPGWWGATSRDRRRWTPRFCSSVGVAIPSPSPGPETAAWDLEANARGLGLATLLGERLGLSPAASVPCGVALGIPSIRDRATNCVYAALGLGYRRVKIKVAPGWDAMAVRAAREGMAAVKRLVRRRQRRLPVAGARDRAPGPRCFRSPLHPAAVGARGLGGAGRAWGDADHPHLPR